jgi:hypothetical protein
MPHRVEAYQQQMSTTQPQPAYPYAPPAAPPAKHRRSPYDRPAPQRASPPPIATLPTHSGSPSPSAASSLNDRSGVSTPPVPATANGNGNSVSAPVQRRASPPPPHHPAHHYPAYDMPRGYQGGYMYASLCVF